MIIRTAAPVQNALHLHRGGMQQYLLVCCMSILVCFIFCLLLFPCSSGNSIPEWESHIDSHGELFYVQFTSSSNLQQQQQQDANVESSRQQQVNIKKKKKSMSCGCCCRTCVPLGVINKGCVLFYFRSTEPFAETASKEWQWQRQWWSDMRKSCLFTHRDTRLVTRRRLVRLVLFHPRTPSTSVFGDVDIIGVYKIEQFPLQSALRGVCCI